MTILGLFKFLWDYLLSHRYEKKSVCLPYYEETIVDFLKVCQLFLDILLVFFPPS